MRMLSKPCYRTTEVTDQRSSSAAAPNYIELAADIVSAFDEELGATG
jgi:hypothetical protein